MEGYSKIIRWEVWNFMSIEHAVCEYDERNIVNLKGYNDSGKSAMLTALKVCLTNSNPTKQVEFITDEKDYFRVLVVFDDDVRLLRDKYRNGQSLYELYKGDNLLYTTKGKGGNLTKVSNVPDPIKEYLGLIDYDNTYLNFRSCFEKQIGVQTTGSENYKMFNTVLKSEEIAKAGELLNTDKNKLLSDINAVSSEIKANESILGVGQYLSKEEIDYLKKHDAELDKCEEQTNIVNNIGNIKNNRDSIKILPELEIIDIENLKDLDKINNLSKSIKNIRITPDIELIDDSIINEVVNIVNISTRINNIKITPEVNVIEDSQLKDIKAIIDYNVKCNEIKVTPELDKIDDVQLNTLQAINNLLNNLNDCNSYLDEVDNRLVDLDKEIDELQKKSIELGIEMVRCPNCGEIFNPDNQHVH